MIIGRYPIVNTHYLAKKKKEISSHSKTSRDQSSFQVQAAFREMDDSLLPTPSQGPQDESDVEEDVPDWTALAKLTA